MQKKIGPAIALIIAVAAAFAAGYWIGTHENRSTGGADQAVMSRWVPGERPPTPKVRVDGKEIAVVLGGFSWCWPAGGDSKGCVTTDAAIPKEADLKPVVVPAGSKIETTAPQGIKEFTLVNMKDTGEDPYFVPKTPGTYTYSIHCEWFLDQGQADFYFAVKVE